uniref:Lariat debranching enzyme C-terminal domain-containing protein n=1 Tax=Acrobeloides nanus TaxID=290746 RepID=A0A914CS51_9BILA
MSTPESRSSGENVKKEELSLNEAPDAAAGSVDSAQEAPNKPMKPKRFLRLAVAGCSHGEMDKIYGTLTQWERQNGKKFDLLICTGDFQAIRNYGDLHYMKCPDKFKHLMTFYKYYSGEQVAPVLTIFIGGNHESSGYMAELPYGGWVAPNIYFMGYSSVVRFGGLRIAGLSGIYDIKDFQKGHFERPPFEFGPMVSAYHVKSVDMFKLKQLRSRDDSFTPNPVDIMVTHDWPAGITDYGDVHGLLRIKPYFEADIQMNKLGNPAAMGLLNDIRPKYWFSSHLHCVFRAEVPHDAPNSSLPTPEPTKFLALDKPLPRRKFLESIDIPIEENAQMQLEYDPIWLAIMKNTDRFTEVTDKIIHLPSPASASRNERWDFRPTDEEIAEVGELFEHDFKIPENFRQTAPPHQPTDKRRCPPSLYYRNPQTMEFCQKLKIKDFNLLLCQVPGKTHFIGEPQYMIEQLATNPNEIHLDDDDEDKFGDDDFIIDTSPRRGQQNATLMGTSTVNPESNSNSQLNTTEVELKFDEASSDNQNEIIQQRDEGTPTVQRETTGGRVLKRRHVDIPDEE